MPDFIINIVEPIPHYWSDLPVEGLCACIAKQTELFRSECLLDIDQDALRLPFFCSIKLSDDAEIQTLNKSFRNKNKPTNVLSFPSGDIDELDDGRDALYLGDIIIAYETVEREAKEQSKAFEAHVAHLMLHGILHLLGHDHEDDNEAQTMENLEIMVIERMGYTNPYLGSDLNEA